MESKKRWNTLSNEKQYLHEVNVKQIVIHDVLRLLEEQFGSKKGVPEKSTDALRKDNNEIAYRIKLLKMADKGSWSALERYAADPLYDDKETTKNWKAALKEAKRIWLRRKVPDMATETEIEAETDIVPEAGETIGETAVTERLIGT